MLSATQTAPTSQTTIWIGRSLSALAVLFLIFDSVIKVLSLAPAVEATTQLGFAANLVVGIGILELACLVAYIIPRVSVLGAFLGSALVSELTNGLLQSRVGEFWLQTYLGLMLLAAVLIDLARRRLVARFGGAP